MARRLGPAVDLLGSRPQLQGPRRPGSTSTSGPSPRRTTSARSASKTPMSMLTRRPKASSNTTDRAPPPEPGAPGMPGIPGIAPPKRKKGEKGASPPRCTARTSLRSTTRHRKRNRTATQRGPAASAARSGRPTASSSPASGSTPKSEPMMLHATGWPKAHTKNSVMAATTTSIPAQAVLTERSTPRASHDRCKDHTPSGWPGRRQRRGDRTTGLLMHTAYGAQTRVEAGLHRARRRSRRTSQGS